ncbi:hypothetical protein SCHPADRAFT_925578 [Schizopora paradoxa]|uniref:Uncharacterized protein n=1 Tax=Schizopora paradoxa TaxID=27342 RepID=A0A0H2SLB4_9AGAM|nr:hypothetical protein SCHPADRAFT_925578 [Schizopora paradoxa]
MTRELARNIITRLEDRSRGRIATSPSHDDSEPMEGPGRQTVTREPSTKACIAFACSLSMNYYECTTPSLVGRGGTREKKANRDARAFKASTKARVAFFFFIPNFSVPVPVPSSVFFTSRAEYFPPDGSFKQTIKQSNSCGSSRTNCSSTGSRKRYPADSDRLRRKRNFDPPPSAVLQIPFCFYFYLLFLSVTHCNPFIHFVGINAGFSSVNLSTSQRLRFLLSATAIMKEQSFKIFLLLMGFEAVGLSGRLRPRLDARFEEDEDEEDRFRGVAISVLIRMGGKAQRALQAPRFGGKTGNFLLTSHWLTSDERLFSFFSLHAPGLDFDARFEEDSDSEIHGHDTTFTNDSTNLATTTRPPRATRDAFTIHTRVQCRRVRVCFDISFNLICTSSEVEGTIDLVALLRRFFLRERTNSTAFLSLIFTSNDTSWRKFILDDEDLDGVFEKPVLYFELEQLRSPRPHRPSPHPDPVLSRPVQKICVWQISWAGLIGELELVLLREEEGRARGDGAIRLCIIWVGWTEEREEGATKLLASSFSARQVEETYSPSVSLKFLGIWSAGNVILMTELPPRDSGNHPRPRLQTRTRPQNTGRTVVTHTQKPKIQYGSVSAAKLVTCDDERRDGHSVKGVFVHVHLSIHTNTPSAPLHAANTTRAWTDSDYMDLDDSASFHAFKFGTPVYEEKRPANLSL